MNKNTFTVGFMLFAIFFGAGNLIFPPKIGFESGEFFWPAIIGFVLTGVSLPLMTIITGSFDEGGYKAALRQINPVFGVVFLVAIFLTIGPLFAIPRTATTSYEMALVPFMEGSGIMSRFLFTIAFFLISFWFAFNPSKMVDRVGAILTPVLLVSILLLIIKGFITFSGLEHTPTVTETFKTTGGSFFTGFTEGYLTMDAIAAVAFSVIVLNAIKAKGVTKETGLFKQTVLAGIVASTCLAVIYLSLGWLGNHYHISADQLNIIEEKGMDIRTFLLTNIAHDTFGDFGKTLIGIIVTLACLTTSIGLTVAISEYFHEILPKLSYKVYALIFTLISFGLANQGLSTIIKTSEPVLMILYPIAMTVLIVMILAKIVPTPPLAQQIAVGLVTIISILSVFHGLELVNIELINHLPLKEQAMEWLPFALVGYLIGFIIGIPQRKIVYK